MKVEIIVLVCSLALSHAVQTESRTTLDDIESVNGVQSSDSLKPFTRKARLIGGLGGIGGVGIVGGIGIVGGGVKGLGIGSGSGVKYVSIKHHHR